LTCAIDPTSRASEDYGCLSYVQPFVRIEIGARSDQEPSEQIWIQSPAAQHFPDLFTNPALRRACSRPSATFLGDGHEPCETMPGTWDPIVPT
jgi:hypothetical protein